MVDMHVFQSQKENLKISRFSNDFSREGKNQEIFKGFKVFKDRWSLCKYVKMADFCFKKCHFNNLLCLIFIKKIIKNVQLFVYCQWKINSYIEYLKNIWTFEKYLKKYLILTLVILNFSWSSENIFEKNNFWWRSRNIFGLQKDTDMRSKRKYKLIYFKCCERRFIFLR